MALLATRRRVVELARRIRGGQRVAGDTIGLDVLAREREVRVGVLLEREGVRLEAQRIMAGRTLLAREATLRELAAVRIGMARAAGRRGAPGIAPREVGLFGRVAFGAALPVVRSVQREARARVLLGAERER